jgi:hypothetical protein
MRVLPGNSLQIRPSSRMIKIREVAHGIVADDPPCLEKSAHILMMPDIQRP